MDLKIALFNLHDLNNSSSMLESLCKDCDIIFFYKNIGYYLQILIYFTLILIISLLVSQFQVFLILITAWNGGRLYGGIS